MSVVVRDISATGVGIVHDLPLPVGEKYAVKQDALPPDPPGLFTVVRSDAMPDGQYGIGLHASHLLDPRAAAVQSRRRGDHKSHRSFPFLASIVFILAIAALMLFCLYSPSGSG